MGGSITSSPFDWRSPAVRVLHVHSGNIFGGIETFQITLARFRAVYPEMEPEFALCFEDRLAREIRSEGVPVHILGEVRARHPWKVMRARSVLRRLVASGRYDVALTHSAWSQSILAPTLRRSGLPLAFYLHDIVEGRHWVEWTARWTPPDLVICDSRHTARSLPNLFPGVRSEVLLYALPPAPADGPGARERLRAEFGARADTAVIIQVSRLEEWKGHRLHIEALGLLRDVPGWVCWMVGGVQRPHEREYLASLARRARDLGISDRLLFLGQRSDVPALLASADIHCQPNTGPEPFGITFVEALSAGLPVVTTAMGGALEIVNETCGLLVPPEPGALADALRRMVREPGLRRRLGASGPARAKDLCDPATQIPSLGRLLAGIVRPSR
jgi:glycosyltransferase involved in cell wall biosynthesis